MILWMLYLTPYKWLNIRWRAGSRICVGHVHRQSSQQPCQVCQLEHPSPLPSYHCALTCCLDCLITRVVILLICLGAASGCTSRVKQFIVVSLTPCIDSGQVILICSTASYTLVAFPCKRHAVAAYVDTHMILYKH